MNNPIPNIEQNARDKFRAALRLTCVQQGFPLDHLDETIDLTMHAVDQGLETVARVCGSSPDPRVRLAAIPLALQLLSQFAEDKAREIIAITSASDDCATFEAVIEVQP